MQVSLHFEVFGSLLPNRMATVNAATTKVYLFTKEQILMVQYFQSPLNNLDAFSLFTSAILYKMIIFAISG